MGKRQIGRTLHKSRQPLHRGHTERCYSSTWKECRQEYRFHLRLEERLACETNEAHSCAFFSSMQQRVEWCNQNPNRIVGYESFARVYRKALGRRWNQRCLSDGSGHMMVNLSAHPWHTEYSSRLLDIELDHNNHQFKMMRDSLSLEPRVRLELQGRRLRKVILTVRWRARSGIQG